MDMIQKDCEAMDTTLHDAISRTLNSSYVPDSGRQILPAGKCVTGMYHYWPVLGCRFQYSANGRSQSTAAGGNTSGVFVYLY